MRQIPGQLNLLDTLADLAAANPEKHTCPHCAATYWAPPNAPRWAMEYLDAEHIEVEPGICARMAEVREAHERFLTGRQIMEPHWSRQQYRIYELQAQDIYEHVWRAYHSRQEAR